MRTSDDRAGGFGAPALEPLAAKVIAGPERLEHSLGAPDLDLAFDDHVHEPAGAHALGDRLAGLVDVMAHVVGGLLRGAHLDDVAADDRPDDPVREDAKPPVPGGERDRPEDDAPHEPGEASP